MTRAEYKKHLIDLFGEDFSNQDRFEVSNVKIDSIGLKLEIDGYRIQLYSGGILTENLSKKSDKDVLETFCSLVEGFKFLEDIRPLNVSSTYLAVYPTSNQLPIDKEEILNCIEEFLMFHKEAGVEESYTKRSQKYTFDSKKQNTGLTVAAHIKHCMNWNLGHQLSRGGSLFDMVDNDITIGESINRTEENSYREHIVPCDLIIEESIKMFEDGKSIEEVSVMISSNLFIVLISKEEAEKLDHVLGLKTTMPKGWSFGDNVFERLDVAKIEYKTF